MYKFSEDKEEKIVECRGTPHGKTNIQVLVYGEFQKYKENYELVDSTDKKGNACKAKKLLGTYAKVPETNSRWNWVSLDKIQHVYPTYAEEAKEDKFGYLRAQPKWTYLNADETKLRKLALANEHDDVALAKRTRGPKSGEEIKKLQEKQKEIEVVQISPEEPPPKKPKRNSKEGSADAAAWMKTWSDVERKTLEDKVSELEKDRNMFEACHIQSDQDCKALKKELEEANKIVEKYNNLPTQAKIMDAATLSEFSQYETKFKTLAKSIKTHFEGEMMSFNKNCTSKKDYRTIHEVAPPTLIEQWEHK